MAKKYYNGNLLPDIEPLWDKTIYPYAYISIGSCANLGYTTDTTMKGRYAHLVFVDTTGYIEKGSTVGTNSYIPYNGTISGETYIIALDDDCVESFSSLWPGINTETWLESTNEYFAAAAAGEGPHWTNTTLYDADGNLFLEASEPVAAFDLTAWLTGYALGLCGKPLPFSTKKEPVAYMYNGVRLPKLPEWDRVAYPYAVINGIGIGDAISYYRLSICNKYNVFEADSGYIYFGESSGGSTDITFMQSECNPTNGTWSDFEEASSRNITITGKTNSLFKPANWSNVDITLDGTTYLTASDPVPVYE